MDTTRPYIVQKRDHATGVVVYLLGHDKPVGSASWGAERHKAERFATEEDAQAVAARMHRASDETVTVVTPEQ